MDEKEVLAKIAKRLRIHSLKMTTRAGSGHPTTCLSMAELTVSCGLLMRRPELFPRKN